MPITLKQRLRMTVLLTPVFAALNLWMLALASAVSPLSGAFLWQMTALGIGVAAAEAHLVSMAVAEAALILKGRE